MTEAKRPVPLVVDASVLLAFYLPTEPYKVDALSRAPGSDLQS
jgi:hypothetical protein